LSLAEAREDFGERAETLRLLTNTIRGFARKELVGAEKEVEETGEMPERIVSQLKELGLFVMTVPEEPVFPLYYGTTNGVSPFGLINFGTVEQKVRYLPAIASGECMASFCLIEPDSATDTSRNIRSSAFT
jgi:acyl-CoA dehydrogenase